MYVIKL